MGRREDFGALEGVLCFHSRNVTDCVMCHGAASYPHRNSPRSLHARISLAHTRTCARTVAWQIFAMLCDSWVLVSSMPCGSNRLDGKDLSASLLGRVVGRPHDGVQVWVNPMHIDVEHEFGLRGGCSSVPYSWPPIPMPI